MSISDSLGKNIGQAAVVGGIHLGGQVLLTGDKLNQKALVKAGESGACALATEYVIKMIRPPGTLSDPGSSKASYINTALPSLVSGGLYTGLNMLTKADNTSVLYQFLLQAGSHAAGSAVYPVVLMNYYGA